MGGRTGRPLPNSVIPSTRHCRKQMRLDELKCKEAVLSQPWRWQAEIANDFGVGEQTSASMRRVPAAGDA